MTISAYETKKGKRWKFNAYVGTDPDTGKKIITSRGGFTSKREAESALRTMRYEFDHKILRASTNATFRDVTERWLDVYKNTVRDSTYQKTLECLRNHILPTFGEKNIDAIRALQCQDFANHLSTVFKDYRKIYSVATRIFNYAITIGVTNRANPFLRVVMPKNDTSHAPTPFFEKSELAEILDAMKDNKRWYTFFRLLAYTGLRRGEVLALLWSDIDFKAGTLTVSKTLSTGVDNAPVVHETKTKSGLRTIDVDRETLRILNEWLLSQKTLSIKGLIFPSGKGIEMSISKPYAYFQRVANKLGIKGTIHSFRHTHASMLFEAGWSIKDVQERLGHKDFKTTMDIYTHVTKRRKKESMKDFEKFISC